MGSPDGAFEVPPPSSAMLFEVAQFTARKRAWDTLDVSAIVARARRDGVERPSIEANAVRAGAGRIRLTASVMMSLRMINAWNAASELALQKHDGALLADIADAVSAAFRAIDASHARASVSPTHGIGKMAGQ